MTIENLALEIGTYRENLGNDYQRIAEAVGLSKTALKTHVKDIKRVLRNHDYQGKNLELIARDLNMSETASELLLETYTPAYRRKIKHDNSEKKYTETEKDEIMNLAIECGAETISEISELTDMSRYIVGKFVKKYGKETKRKHSRFLEVKNKHFPERDKMITEGHTLQEISNLEGLTRERIRQYINETGQYEIWKERRESVKKKIRDQKDTGYQQLQQARTNLISTLNNAVDKAAEKQGWPMQKAVEYSRSFKRIKRKRIQEEALIKIFERYKEAENLGKKTSLTKLGEGIDVSIVAVSRILEKTGLLSKWKSLEKVKSSPNRPITNLYDSKEAIKVREREELNKADLVRLLSKRLCIPDEEVYKFKSAMSQYENGHTNPIPRHIISPGMTSKSGFSHEYLKWLKENGYDPYDLPNE